MGRQRYALEKVCKLRRARPTDNAPPTSGQTTNGDRRNISTLPKGSFLLELTDAAVPSA